MIDFINKTISGFFGKKSDRDIKSIDPIVAKIHESYKLIEQLSNDGLRQKSNELKAKVAAAVQAEEQKVKELKAKVETDEIADVDQKEKIYVEIDALNKEITKKIQAALDDILPDAFAIVKETAKRFKENNQLEVTATSMDRDLSAKKGNVVIQGEKAFYKNQWIAAGNTVTWDMVHYDVQLIGGVVLHQGKISEMATGEGKTLVAYMADITYGTNNEFGFDYLRDNMARSPEDMVQRVHNFAIVDEVDSVLIDDARTPLIISGPTAKGDIHEFQALKPQVEKLVTAQRNYVNTALAEGKKLFAENKLEDAGIALLRAFRGLPKNKALIKYLSEQGVRAQLQKTENFYMQDHGKEMHKIDAELYFVIDEKNNSIELTEKGIELVSKTAEDAKFFVLPDIGSEIVDIEKSSLNAEEKIVKKDALMRDFAVASERVHTVNQLLKAYTLFEIDVEYVVMENKIKIVDEQTGRILDGRRYSDGLHQACRN